MRAYARDAVTYRYAREAIAIREHRIANPRDAVANSYAREAIAIIERRRADALDASYRYAREGATCEGIIFDLGYTIGDYKICKKLIFVRSRFLNIKLLCAIYGVCTKITKAYITPRGYISAAIYAREAGATTERFRAYARDAASYRYARKA